MLLTFGLMTLSACDLLEDILSQITTDLNDQEQEATTESEDESMEPDDSPIEQEAYPPMTVAERIESENLEVYDSPNGAPLYMSPEKYILVEEPDYEAEAPKLKYCFDDEMDKMIADFEDILNEYNAVDISIEKNESPKMNTKAQIRFVLDPDYEELDVEAVFYIDEFGIFTGNNCMDLYYYY